MMRVRNITVRDFLSGDCGVKESGLLDLAQFDPTEGHVEQTNEQAFWRDVPAHVRVGAIQTILEYREGISVTEIVLQGRYQRYKVSRSMGVLRFRLTDASFPRNDAAYQDGPWALTIRKGKAKTCYYF